MTRIEIRTMIKNIRYNDNPNVIPPYACPLSNYMYVLTNNMLIQNRIKREYDYNPLTILLVSYISLNFTISAKIEFKMKRYFQMV